MGPPAPRRPALTQVLRAVCVPAVCKIQRPNQPAHHAASGGSGGPSGISAEKVQVAAGRPQSPSEDLGRLPRSLKCRWRLTIQV